MTYLVMQVLIKIVVTKSLFLHFISVNNGFNVTLLSSKKVFNSLIHMDVFWRDFLFGYVLRVFWNFIFVNIYHVFPYFFFLPATSPFCFVCPCPQPHELFQQGIKFSAPNCTLPLTMSSAYGKIYKETKSFVPFGLGIPCPQSPLNAKGHDAQYPYKKTT